MGEMGFLENAFAARLKMSPRGLKMAPREPPREPPEGLRKPETDPRQPRMIPVGLSGNTGG